MGSVDVGVVGNIVQNETVLGHNKQMAYTKIINLKKRLQFVQQTYTVFYT